MAKDAVCGMQVAEASAAATVEYKGRAFYFCSPACKRPVREKPGEVRREVAYSRALGSATFFSRCRLNFSMRYSSVLRVMFRNAAARV